MWRTATLAALGAVALLFVGGLVVYGLEKFHGPGPLASDTIVHIPRGSGVDQIAARLDSAGVIDSRLVFLVGARATGKTRALQAGEYLFPAGVSIGSAIDLLVSGKTVVRRLTLAEGLSSVEAMALLDSAEALAGGIDAVPAEGSLLPETYHYVRGDTRADLVQRMQEARDKLLAELWPRRTRDLPLSGPEEAIILASIVEEETAVPEERPLIASVFLNRLARGMRLQSDPTVVYALNNGAGPLGRSLTRADLQFDHPYNTYLNAGLPPGPISNPGRASIEAVLNPAQTDYLYFVADGDGGHNFSKTLEEHNRNVARWRKAQEQQTSN